MKDLSVNLSNLRPLGGVQDSTITRGSQDKGGAQLFKEALSKASLENAVGAPPAQPSSLRFSNHAVDRMQSRGIHFSPEQMGKIENAVGRAAEKGSKNCLLLAEEAALIVSVKDKTVVTVMDKANLKENVFTNIDSTVMI